MKKILIILCVCLMASCHVFAKQNLFANFPDGNNVERVYVGGSILSMAGGVGVVSKYSGAIKKAKGVEVYNIDNPSAKEMEVIKSQLKVILQKFYGEEIVKKESANESSEIYLLYNRKPENEEAPAGMLIVNIEPRAASFVFIEGAIDFNRMIF